MTACECEVVQRGGAYAGYGIITILYAGALLQGLYDIPAVKYDGYRVYANLPPCGAMRGHGSVDTRHAFECLLDRMARELGLDPFAVRRANLLQAPTRTLNDLMVNSYGLAECLDKVERASGWRERLGKLPPGKGLGMACSHYVSGAAKPIHWTGEPHAVVNLKLDFDGGITALTGAADIGQGSSTMVAIAVAETLGHVARPHPRHRRRHRRHAQGQRRLFVAHHLHGRQRGDRCRQEAQGHARRGGGAQARGAPGRHRMRRRDVPRRQRRSIEPCRSPTWWRRRWSTTARSPSRERSPARRKPRAASTAAAPSARPWASATPPRWSRSASTMRPAWSPSTRSGWRSTAAMPSIRWRSKDRSRDRSGWAWARRCARRPAISKACRRMPACSNIACRRSRNPRRSRSISSKATIRTDRSAPRKRAKARLAGFPPALVNAIANAIGIDLNELPVTPDRVMEALIQRRRQARLASTMKAAS